jgi:hypothetical protein
MSAWVVITKADLNNCNIAAVNDALSEEALAEGQADPFDDVMHARADYVRNRICGRVTLSATPYSVPPELLIQATWIVLETMIARLGLALELTKDQLGMITRAYKDLDIAGTEDLPISAPDDAAAADVQQQGGIRVVSKRTRTITGRTMDGL